MAPWALARLAGDLTDNRFGVFPLRPVSAFRRGCEQSGVEPRHASLVGLPSRDLRKLVGRGIPALARAIETDTDCFLYVGGTNRRRGLDRWIPRHVVTVLGYESNHEHAQIFEPASGRIFTVPIADLLTPSGRPRPEFGNWCYPQLVVAPIQVVRP